MAESGIGTVNVEFTASTRNFAAAIEEVGASLEATGAKAGDMGTRIARTIDKSTAAGQHLIAEMERQKVQYGRQADADAAAARVMEEAALKADILARADAELAKSAEVTGSKFQMMSAQIREAMSGIGEKITATAEKAELSADGIAAGFGGIGKLLGAGLLGDFVAHTLDNLAELGATLEDLHQKTGMAVQDLAGLRLIAQSKDLDFTTISMGLTRLGKAMYEAKQGMTEDREAFSSLGISMKEVNTLSVEQMLYRISDAFGKNRDLVIADGTALELFGRGGKELVPMLREYGDGLEAASKQQGALTGWTNESAAASQQWLKATSDLSAEFHAGMLPVLVDLVKLLPYIETGFDALEYDVELVFGTIVNAIATAVEAMDDYYKAWGNLAHLRGGAAMADLKDMWTADKSGWDLQAGYLADLDKAQRAAQAAIGKPFPALGSAGQNRSGDVDGALLKQAKQQLATMEQKHALSRAQLINFWQSELAKAQPGSIDYEQVNTVLGNLMQRAGSGRGTAAGGVETLRVGGPSRIEEYTRENDRTSRASASKDTEFQMQGMEARRKAIEDYGAAIEETREKMAKLAEQGQLSDVSMALSHGLITQYQGLAAEARVHEATFAAELADVDKRLADARALASLPGMAPEIAKLEGQRAELVESGRQQSVSDQVALQTQSGSDRAAAQSLTLSGATLDALAKMADDWDRMTAKIADALSQTVSGLNEDLVNALTTKHYHGDHAVSRAVGGTVAQGGRSLLSAGLENAEGGVLGKFGIKSKKKPTGAAGDALHVLIDNLPGGIVNQGASVAATAARIAGMPVSSGSAALAARIAALPPSPMGATQAKLASLLGPTAVFPSDAGTSSNPTDLANPGLALGPIGQDVDSLNIPGSTTVTRPQQSQIPSLITKLTGSFLGGLFGGNSSKNDGSDDGDSDDDSDDSGFQGFFASGGPVIGNHPTIVGETGPELFVPSSAGRIVPSGQFGNTTVHHTISVDARGSTDPAQTEAAVNRAMQRYIPHIISASVARTRDQQLRRPSSSR